MQVVFERYEFREGLTRSDTMTIDDAKWNGELARFARDWFGVARRQADRPMPWQETDVDGMVLE